MTIGGVKGTKSGAYYIVDVEVEGPGTFTLSGFEKIRDGVEGGVKEEVKGVKIVRLSIRTRKE